MGPMQPQQGQPNAYAQMFNAHRGAQQPQQMQAARPMQPMGGPPPTGQAGPQQGMNPYAAMLQQARPQAPAMSQQQYLQGQQANQANFAQQRAQLAQHPMVQQHLPLPPGQMPGAQQMNPAVAQQRMALAQQMAQQGRPQMQSMGMPGQAAPQLARPPGMLPADGAGGPANPYANTGPANPWGAR